jgi:hypothetical protein
VFVSALALFTGSVWGDDDFMRRTDPETLPVVFDLDAECPFGQEDLAEPISELLDDNSLSSNTEQWSRENGGFFLNLDCLRTDVADIDRVDALHATLDWSYPDSLHGEAVYPDIEVDAIMVTVVDDDDAMLDAIAGLFARGLERYKRVNSLP